jgi:lysyl-tRNA synthetase class 2
LDSKTLIQQRADFYRDVRNYFQGLDVLEVEVPILGRSGPTDLHLASMSLFHSGEPLFLQTSPEFFMKRLLAQGSGDIFAICKSFREAEVGNRHNPEFSMLEWYRCGFSLDQLMADVQALVQGFLPQMTFDAMPYSEVFEHCLGVNPHSATDQHLTGLASKHTGFEGELDRSGCLDLLMSQCIEPTLGKQACFLYDFPACQAAMAQIGPDREGQQVARRFELYIDGMEIANGYLELRSSKEQRERFERDNRARQIRRLPTMPIDEVFLQALDQMPDCAGVALGIDRLLWLVCFHRGLIEDSRLNLGQVLLFPWQKL